MFAPYTQIDRCIGREVTVRTNGENFTGMLAGVYTLHGLSIMVLTPANGGGLEQHIPVQSAVVTLKGWELERLAAAVPLSIQELTDCDWRAGRTMIATVRHGHRRPVVPVIGGGKGTVTTSVYVGNLPWSTTAEDLRALFEPYGEVENARIVTDRETGRSRGFGFIDMAEAEPAQKAIAELNNYDYGGRPLTVNEALSRQGAGGPGGAGGTGGGGGRT